MLLGGGTGDFIRLLQQYPAMIAKYQHRPLAKPVIIVIDNDSGASGIFKMLKNIFGTAVTHTSKADFYKIYENLYLVKTPESNTDGHSAIEDFFDSSVTARLISGKPFDRNKDHGDSSSYGKQVFAEKVVKPEMGTIDFSKFSPLLERIGNAIDHHASR